MIALRRVRLPVPVPTTQMMSPTARTSRRDDNDLAGLRRKVGEIGRSVVLRIVIRAENGFREGPDVGTWISRRRIIVIAIIVV
jgi:hypothetical protein